MDSVCPGMLVEKAECRNCSLLLCKEEEILEELGNKFLYQEYAGCPVHGPETL